MSLITDRNEYGGYLGSKCHVCHKELGNGFIVEHTGAVLLFDKSQKPKEDFGSIAMHQECAVILILRLSNDIMQVKEFAQRMPEKLRQLRTV